MLFLTLLALETSSVSPRGQTELQARIEHAPREVAKFVERRAACNHWDGEVGSGYLDREKQIQTERAKLRCNAIDADVTTLRKKYRKDSAVLKLLDDTQDLQPW